MGETIKLLWAYVQGLVLSFPARFYPARLLAPAKISFRRQSNHDSQLSVLNLPSPGSSTVAQGRGRRLPLTLALLAPALFLLGSNLAYASGEPGGFTQWGAGARSLGMGRAFLAVSDDASASYWNPAGMVQLERKELTALQATLFADTSYTFLSYVHPGSKMGAWGFNMARLQSGGFEKIKTTVDPSSPPDNPNFLKVEDLGAFNVSQQAMTFAYGKQVTQKLSMGLALKRITSTVDTFSQSFTGVDASVLSKVNDNYRFALAIRNAVTQAPAASSDRLPLTVRIGNSYKLLNGRILLAGDVTSNKYTGLGWNVGTEYWATRKVAFRMGIESRNGAISETTAGVGFGVGSASLDLAFGVTELGMSQRYSLSWKFGKNASQGRGDEMRRLVKAGETAFQKGLYAQAVARLEQALSVDPSNKDLQQMVNKMNAIAGSIPSATGDGDVDRLVRQGVAAYVQGDMQTAYDSLRTAYEKNPSNQNLMNFTNKVARTAGLPLVEPPRDSVSGARWTLVDQKLHDSLSAIYEGRYDVAITKCEQVLRIDPSNVTAIGRMGAAFFLMGEKEKAITLWRRALELEPNNQTAVEYLKQLGAYK